MVPPRERTLSIVAIMCVPLLLTVHSSHVVHQAELLPAEAQEVMLLMLGQTPIRNVYQVLLHPKAVEVRIAATVAHHHLLQESTTAQIVRAYHVNALHPQAQVQYREVQEAEVLAVARTPVREAVAPADDG